MTHRSLCPQEISAADQAYCMLHSPWLSSIPGLFRLICDRYIRALRGRLLYFHKKMHCFACCLAVKCKNIEMTQFVLLHIFLRVECTSYFSSITAGHFFCMTVVSKLRQIFIKHRQWANTQEHFIAHKLRFYNSVLCVYMSLNHFVDLKYVQSIVFIGLRDFIIFILQCT